MPIPNIHYASLINIEPRYAALAAALNPGLLAIWPGALSPDAARSPREAEAAKAYRDAMNRHLGTVASQGKPARPKTAFKVFPLRPRRGRRSQP